MCLRAVFLSGLIQMAQEAIMYPTIAVEESSFYLLSLLDVNGQIMVLLDKD